MTRATRLITVEVPLCDTVPAFEAAIRATLETHGQPLSSIVVEIDSDRQVAIVDALIIPVSESAL